MELNLDDISKIVTLSKPIIDPLISAFITPKIEKLRKWLQKKDVEQAVIDNFFESKFLDYLSITLNRCRNVNVLIFPNQQIDIEKIYYPLTISPYNREKRYLADNLESSFFDSYKKILISDTAGMGKSTLTKWISKKAIEQNLAIPILIELRNLKEDHTVLDEIFHQMNPIDGAFDRDLIIRFIELGNFLIIFDGFDEIQLKSQELIIKDLRSFVNKAKNNWFLLTSRPEGALSAFGDFLLFNIEPLDSIDAFKLIQKYDSISPYKIGKNLIHDIKDKLEQVEELLGNPFLVSLLYSTYTYNKDIPANKLSFYEEIYFALFKKHDLSKDGWTRPKKSKLDIQQFRILLRQLAFDTTILGEISYSETELVNLLNEAIGKCPGLEVSSSEFIEDIVSAVPLFQRDGLKIKWAHKSLQDFFAAEYIAYDSKKELFLETIYDKDIDNFDNILDFIMELDYKSFRKTIIKKLLNDFISHFDNSYDKIDTSIINISDINLRKARTFGAVYYFKQDKFDEQGDDYDPFDFFPKNTNKQSQGYIISTDHIALILGSMKITIIEKISSKPNSFIKESIIAASEERIEFPDYKIHELKDHPNLFLNSNTNFKKVTNELYFAGNSTSKFKFPIIDYQEAKNEIRRIDSDVKKEEEMEIFTMFKK